MMKVIPSKPATQSETATREMAIYRATRGVAPIFGKLRAEEIRKAYEQAAEAGIEESDGTIMRDESADTE